MPPKKSKKNLFQMLSGFDNPKEQREYYKGQPKKELTLHTALEGLGSIPGYGEPFDFANAMYYFTEGKKGDAALSMLSMAPFLGSIMPVYRGTMKGLDPKDIVGKTNLGDVMQGGGEYTGFQNVKNTLRPYWAALSKSEPASYPRDIVPIQTGPNMFAGNRSLWEVNLDVDAIRKYAHNMEKFDPTDYPYFNVQQAMYTDASGKTIFRKGKKLHTIFQEGLPLSEVKSVKVYDDVSWNQNPMEYYDYQQQFVEPILGASRDVTEEIMRYARDMKGKY